jgi:hypothetical protein
VPGGWRVWPPGFAKGAALKNVLDMLEEFSQLNDERIASNGWLDPDAERRWRALKALYEIFNLPAEADMRPPVPDSAPGCPDSAQIRRAGIRVPTDMHIFLRHEDDHFSSRVLNMSRGGLFVNSKSILLAGSPIKIFLPNVDCNYGELFETEGEVAWSNGGPSGTLLHGMGISFRKLRESAAEQLDAFLIEILDTRL